MLASKCGLRAATYAAILAMGAPVAAQTMPPAPPPPMFMAPPTPPPPPSSLAVGSQYYDGTLDGFRKYLETLRATDRKLYAALDPKLTSLEEQQMTGTIVTWSGVVAGAGLAAWGVAKMATGLDDGECDKYGPGTDQWSRCTDQKMNEMKDEHNQGLVFLGIGVGVAVAGFVGGLIIKPGRTDLLDLVNEHNRQSPSSPMRLQLGFDPAARRLNTGLRLDFDVTNLL